MFLVFGAITVLLIAIILFAFPSLSPIPYYPTNWKDLKKIVKTFHLTNSSHIIDLGAGTGTVVFALADYAYTNDLTSQFTAVEINPILVFILIIKKLFHPHKNHIHIAWKDLFKTNYNVLLKNKMKPTVYLYVSPRLLDKIHKKIKKNIPKASVISYMYAIPHLKPSETNRTGNHPIYVYNKV